MLAAALAFLLIAAAGWMIPSRLTAQEAKAQAKAEPVDLAGILYALNDGQPKAPETECEPFQPKAECYLRQTAQMEAYQSGFRDHVHQLQDAKNCREVIWTRKGDDFPKHNMETGEMSFTFGLEGKGQGKPRPLSTETPKPTPTPSPLQKKTNSVLARMPLGKADKDTCVQLRTLADMPLGISAGIWPDQGDANTKKTAFSHPCLRSPEWKAVVRVEPETAREWEKRAKADGWQLEMSFRVSEWEGPFKSDWSEDARLSGDDLLLERRLWLVVDEVRLVIGGLVVHRWNSNS